MRVTKVTSIVVAAIYIFLWVLAFNGASGLVALLAVPLVLAVLVAFGVWLNRFMGITPRRQHFEERHQDEPASTPQPPASPASVEDVGERRLEGPQ